MECKYSLIISQCYHQYHMFLVEIPTDFIEKGRKMIKELAIYKGEEDTSYLGDIGSCFITSKPIIVCKNSLEKQLAKNMGFDQVIIINYQEV